MVGTTISHYKVLEKIGQGGMGEVFLARDTKLDRKVALKFLPDFLQEDPTAKKRFLREAKSAAALDHPYICHIHEVGESHGKDFIAMEYVQGQTLKDKLTKGPLPLKEALETAVQMAAAVEKAHGKGIVHRDLKPSNVMVTPDGHVKVMDFGLAKRLLPEDSGSQEQTVTGNLTKTGTTLGTLAYMSPEQLRGQEVDTRSDIFSFGVVFYEMLTGVHPFKKAQSVETSSAILSEVPPPLPRYMNEVPPVLQHSVRKMLAKEPGRRYQVIDDVRIDLADLVDEVASVQVHGEQAVSQPPEVRTSVAERSWWWAVVAVMAILLAVSLWSPWRAAPTREQPVSRFAVTLPRDQTFPERGTFIEFSPDGRQLAYIAETSGVRHLYLRPLNELESRPLANVEQPSHPVFSPDGKWLAFFNGDDLLVQKLSLTGGVPQTLCDFVSIGKGWYFGHSWTPNGDALVFGSDTGLLRVSADGGTPEAVTQVQEGEILHAWPQILPGGEAVLFTYSRGLEAGYGISVLSLETGERRTLIERGTKARYVPTGHLLYVWEGRLLAAPFDLDTLQLIGQSMVLLEGIATYEFGSAKFRVSENGTLAYIPHNPRLSPVGTLYTIVWVDREGREETLGAEPRPYRRPRISPDGSRVTLDVFDGSADVWIHDLVRETSTRLTFDPAPDGPALWTPDGRRVVFSSKRDGRPKNLFWKAADGTGQVERLTTSPNLQVPYSFSPDGKTLVFHEWDLGTSRHLGVLSMEGERSSKALLQTQFHEDRPAISPDGRWMAYMSDETGRFEVYVRPFPNVEEGKWPISSEGGFSPLWGPGGRELFYRSGEAMMRVRIETEPTFSASSPQVLFTGGYVAGRSEGTGRQLGDTWGRNYDISPDGQRFLMLKRAEQTEQSAPSQIIVVENWFEELKRLVPTE